MEQTLYHSVLRVSAIVLALVLIFDSGLFLSNTRTLSHNTQQYLANAVGVYASVQTTELNTLTAELTKQQRDLDAREAALAERELKTGISESAAGQNTSTYILSALLAVILLLIILNYILDFLRQRKLVNALQ